MGVKANGVAWQRTDALRILMKRKTVADLNQQQQQLAAAGGSFVWRRATDEAIRTVVIRY